jgi:flagellar hook-associated protein 1 FlgK
LVDRGYSARVSTVPDPDTGLLIVVAYDPSSEAIAPREITSHFEGGAMKATLDIRDRIIPELIEKNNKMAAAFASSFNEVHRRGYGLGDFAEKIGRNFFEIGENSERAAQDIVVSAAIVEDVSAISAAATPNAPGDNVVLNQLISVRTKPILENGNMSLNQYYADYVGRVGLEVERSRQERDADGVLLGDLSKRREAISGVSVDEEAVNLLRWQTAFAASSKVITTADEMLETILNLKR